MNEIQNFELKSHVSDTVNKSALNDIALHPDKWHVIDVRSPQEFAEDHFPNAINLPVLSDSERHDVGKEYVQGDKLKARRMGAALISKNISEHLLNESIFEDKNKSFLIMCFRGGQRSQTFANLLSKIGYKTLVLDKGYKSYRENVLDNINQLPSNPGIAFHGPSGTGKTHLISAVSEKTNIAFLDLEGFAHHRGSRFGALGLQPANQKQFDTSLWIFLLQHASENQTLLVEGESRRIGKCLMPKELYDWLNGCQKFWVELPLDKRSENIVVDYFSGEPDDDYLKTFKDIVNSFTEQKGHDFVNEVNAHVDNREFHQAVKLLLKECFDAAYSKCKDDDSRDSIEIKAKDNQDLLDQVLKNSHLLPTMSRHHHQ